VISALSDKSLEEGGRDKRREEDRKSTGSPQSLNLKKERGGEKVNRASISKRREEDRKSTEPRSRKGERRRESQQSP
jgi:hypothetical protein